MHLSRFNLHKTNAANEELVISLLYGREVQERKTAYRFEIRNGELIKPKGVVLKMAVPSEFVPKCPKCGRPMSMNLRSDNTFVQDEGWDEAAKRYERFLKDNKHKRNVFLELGVGYNTPGIIKYPFWQYTCNLKDAFYICINKGQADIPSEIEEKAICVDADISRVITDMKRSVGK